MAHTGNTEARCGGASQQAKLAFVSRYNQSSESVHGVYLPTCFGSWGSAAPTGSLASSWRLTKAWQVDLGKCIDASPLVVQCRDSGGSVCSTWAIVGSHSAQIVCVDVQAGREIWRVPLDDRIEACAALSARHELVYVGTYAGTLFALDVQSGRTRWTFQAKSTVKSSALVVEEHELVVFGAYDHKLYGLEAAAGRQRWVVDLQGSIFSTPFYCAASRQIFAASTSGLVVALTSALCGDFSGVVEQWKLQLAAPVFAGLNVDVASRILVVGCADGHLYGVDLSSGGVRWQLAADKPVFSTPCVYSPGSAVFGSHDGMLRRVNTQSGALVWAANLGGAIFASPTVVRLGSSVKQGARDEAEESLMCCVATTTGHMFFCDEKTGAVVYQTADSTGEAVRGSDGSGDLGPLFGSPVLIDNWCLLGTRTNFLFGFELAATKT
jgi:outer membrane protein assembly factor BamB